MMNQKQPQAGGCWFCQRQVGQDEIYLDAQEMKNVFTEVFDGFPVYVNFDNRCVCTICMGLMKFIAQDTVAAKIKLSQASDSIKEKASIFKTKFKEKATELKQKADEIREEQAKKETGP